MTLSALVAGGMVPLMGISGARFAAPEAPAPVIDDPIAQLHAEVNEIVGLRASELVELDLDPTPGLPVFFTVPLDGREHDINLFPHSVRSAGYTLLAHRADDTLEPMAPGPVRTLRGEVWDQQGSAVSGSMLDDGLHATIRLADGTRWWIEPVGAFIAGADPSTYVLYHAEDVIESGGLCGATNEWLIREAGKGHGLLPVGDGVPEQGARGAGIFNCAELACDADFQYYQDYGSNVGAVEARIELVINTVNTQYQNQVDISHIISNITVRTSSGTNPYTTNDPGNLLGEVRTWWIGNGGAIPRDTVQLFTGRNLTGGTIGIAWLSGVCNTSFKYSVVESDCCGSLACATDLSAHELGHNWGAGHCSCPGFTMNPSITCANNFTSGSINSIVNYRNGVGCLEDCDGTGGGGGPANDDCADATPINSGTTAFSTVGATTDGPAHAECELSGDGGQTYLDIWFTWTAPCTGDLTVTTCEDLGGSAGYDTDLVVYDGTSCGNLAFLGCNDDDQVNPCGDSPSFHSTLVVPVVQGNDYLIRVGGWNSGDEGTGVLSISCSGEVNGACCFGDGSCQFVTNSACSSGGGTFQGDGVACSPTACPQPTGQCCVANECFEISQANCVASGGSYAGDGSTCAGDPCAATTGACCLTGGVCVSVTSADCAQFGGAYQGDGVNCGPTTCPQDPMGACCIGESCVQDTAAGCASSGGTYQGDGSPCDAGTCSTFCSADIDGPTGGPDGNVDALDILLMIAQWGTPCVGSCEADITGATPSVPDGNVDSLDFLLLISQWGTPANCP